MAEDICGFTGETLIALNDSGYIPIMNIKRGMKLSTGAVVDCVVKYKSQDRLIYHFPGINERFLGITPQQALLFNPQAQDATTKDRWLTPKETNIFVNKKITTTLYNLILADNGEVNTFTVGLYQRGQGLFTCFGLGTLYESEPLLSHPYFSSPMVIHNVKIMKGYKDGLVIITRVSRDFINYNVVEMFEATDEEFSSVYIINL